MPASAFSFIASNDANSICFAGSLSKRLKEEFPIKNDFVFDFDEMEKRKESVKTFSDEEDRDNEEEQTR